MTAELHVKSAAAQQCFYGEFISPATIKREVRSARCFCPTLTKLWVSRQTLIYNYTLITNLMHWLLFIH